MTFEDLGLNSNLIQAISQLGFQTPTPIQKQAIPLLLSEPTDLVALAQTGTGKTAAYGLPILNNINAASKQTQALVLAPTRELCVQISKDLQAYSAQIKDIHIVAVYGGEDIRKQLAKLDRTPQIIVATPGRLIDLLGRKKISLANLQYLILDEADEMLDMGFKDDIQEIINQTPTAHQTMLFSATMPAEIEKIIAQYMTNPKWITIGKRNSGTENVNHIYYVCKAQDKYQVLKRIVDMNPDIYAIIFCRTRQETAEIADKLIKDGYNADALHGELSQAQRDIVMQKFRLHNLQILVATDVAARGLDVNNLTHVINYTLPDDKEVYTHRSGRTGRADKKGISIAIIHQREKHRIKDLEKLLNRTFTQQKIPSGLDVCQKQLYNMIDKMQHVDIQEEQISPYLPQVMKMLDYLTKEELIKRFVSLEFNRFLDYYKDSQDLNLPEKETAKHTGKRAKLKINLGKKDGMTPKQLLKIINDVVGDRSISIGDIDIDSKFTYFQVFIDQKETIIEAFSDIKGIRIAEVKTDKPTSRKAEKAQHKQSNKTTQKRQERTNRKEERQQEQRPRYNSSSSKPWRQRNDISQQRKKNKKR